MTTQQPAVKIVRDDLIHLAYDNFTVSFMRDMDCLEVALIVGDHIEVIDALLVKRIYGGIAVRLMGNWINANLSQMNTTDITGKIDVLVQLCESFHTTFPTYIKLKKGA